MSITAIIAALTALAKAIPALASFCQWGVEQVKLMEARRNEVVARERLDAKDAAVRARIAAVRVQPAPTPEQFRAANGSPGIPGSSPGGTGVDRGGAADNKPAGV
jgi:hypothetical protein